MKIELSEVKILQQKSQSELNRAKIELDQLQDEYNDSILKNLDELFIKDMKFIALERQFNLSNCTTI